MKSVVAQLEAPTQALSRTATRDVNLIHEDPYPACARLRDEAPVDRTGATFEFESRRPVRV